MVYDLVLYQVFLFKNYEYFAWKPRKKKNIWVFSSFLPPSPSVLALPQSDSHLHTNIVNIDGRWTNGWTAESLVLWVYVHILRNMTGFHARKLVSGHQWIVFFLFAGLHENKQCWTISKNGRYTWTLFLWLSELNLSFFLWAKHSDSWPTIFKVKELKFYKFRVYLRTKFF